jgi:hypothetical protein
MIWIWLLFIPGGLALAGAWFVLAAAFFELLDQEGRLRLHRAIAPRHAVRSRAIRPCARRS